LIVHHASFLNAFGYVLLNLWMAKGSLFALAMVFLTIQKLVCQLYMQNVVEYASYINCCIKA